MNFGHMLKTLRLSAGIGLRELSRDIEVSPTYLSLVENGKQAPPSADRVAQIERALQVPSGSLMSLTNGFGSEVALFVKEVPEAVDFLSVAKRNSMKSADFMELTGFLNAFGWDRICRALREADVAWPISSDDSCRGPGSGPYLWPFLDEELIFEIVDATGKEEFLRSAVAGMTARCDDLDEDAVIDALLERERVTSTGIGGGVAIPHAYLPDLDRMIVALARLPQGLEFDSIDGLPVRVALLLIGPRSAENLHLRLLARIARLLSHKNFLKSVLEASVRGEIISIFREAEMRIP